MVPPLSHKPIRRSGNSADYQAAFLQRVHRLLQLAYESLTPVDYSKAEEDDITGDLCKHLKYLTEVAPTERWMRRFSIHDQDPSNDVLAEKTGLARKGKRRPKIDIRIVCKQQIPNQGYCIEAKRLYRSDSVSEYMNEEGVGAFICGDYAMNDDFGGMIGYVQTGEVNGWVGKIEAKMETCSSLIHQVGKTAWRQTQLSGGPGLCFTSNHRRESGRDISIIHVMLAFHAT